MACVKIESCYVYNIRLRLCRINDISQADSLLQTLLREEGIKLTTFNPPRTRTFNRYAYERILFGSEKVTICHLI